MQHAKNAAAFVALTVAVYLLALLSLSRASVGQRTLLQHVTGNTLAPGGQYQSLRRFREAGRYGNVDIVFFGSSHGYRGFDPRNFEKAGMSAFNLSSTNQTPLNAYYVAQMYLPKLSPRLVVFEVYYDTLWRDGLESTRDIAVNTAAAVPNLKMALATRNFGAVNYAIAKLLGWTPDETAAQQAAIDGEKYIAGGYCETLKRRTEVMKREPVKANIDERQLDYLVDVTGYAQSLGARVVWVTHPFPSDHRDTIADYDGVVATIAAAAERAGVPYWDFNPLLHLHPLDDFADFHHLNARGVAKFNAALVAKLRQ